MSSIMYKVAPLLKEYPINHSRIMYNINPIQTVGETSANMPADTTQIQDELFSRLDALQSKVNTIKSVLAKAPKTLPKTNFGPAFVAKHNPLDIVLTFNPTTTQPLGLVKLGQMLEKRFKVQTKIHVHSTATGQKCNLFKASANTGSRQDSQVILTVIYSCAVDDLTAYVGNSRLTGISTVTRFIGRVLDIYQVGDVDLESYLDLADLIGDFDSPKKEKMANAKQLDQHLSKSKFVCGDQATLADFAIYSSLGGIDAKTRGKSLQAYCARMEQL